MIYRNHEYLSKLNKVFTQKMTKQADIESTWKFISISGLEADQIEDYPINQLKRYWQLLDYRWPDGGTFISNHRDIFEVPQLFLKSAQESYLSVYQVVGIVSAHEMVVEDIFTSVRKRVSVKEGELHKPWSLLVTRLLSNDETWEICQEVYSLSPSHIQLFRELREEGRMPNADDSLEDWSQYMKANSLELLKPFITSSKEELPEDRLFHQEINKRAEQLLSGKKTISQHIKSNHPNKIDVLKLFDYLLWKESISDREVPTTSNWTDQLGLDVDFQYSPKIAEALRHEIILSTKIEPEDVLDMTDQLKQGIKNGILPSYMNKVISRIEKFGSLSIEDFQALIDCIEEIRHYYEALDNSEDELGEFNYMDEEVGPVEWPNHLQETIKCFLEKCTAKLSENTRDKYIECMEVFQMYVETEFNLDQLEWADIKAQHLIELCSWWHIDYSWLNTKSDKTQLLTVMKKFSQYLDGIDGRDRWVGWKEHYKPLKEQLIICLDLEKVANDYYEMETHYDPYTVFNDYNAHDDIDIREEYEIFTVIQAPQSNKEGQLRAIMLSHGTEVEIKLETPIANQLSLDYSFEAEFEKKGRKVIIHDIITFFPPLAKPFIK
jgi:hypothetical protein